MNNHLSIFVYQYSVSESEYRQLAGNLDEIIEVHNRLQISLEEGENAATSSSTRPHTPQNQSRIGRILLNHGAAIKSAHTTYWSNHPKAVCIFEKYREGLDKFMEGKQKRMEINFDHSFNRLRMLLFYIININL